MGKQIRLSEAKCKGLTMDAPVEFLAAGESKGPDFVIKAYTGKVVDRWWGKLAISVDGIKAKKKMPILRDHDTGKIVGFSTEYSKDGAFTVSGKFSQKTEHSKDVQGLAEEGFPWQASIRAVPLKIVELKTGSDMMVNGKKLSGPAEVWMESEVSETSFVPLGADGDTSVSMLSRFDEVAQEAKSNPEDEGDKPMEITLEMLQKDAPELLEQIKKSGADAERARIQGVMEMSVSGHEKTIQKLAFDGVTTGPQAAVVILRAEKETREALLRDHDLDAPPPVKQPAPSEDAIPENLTGEARWKAEYEKSAKLQKEFDTVEIYIGAMKADIARGNR